VIPVPGNNDLSKSSNKSSSGRNISVLHALGLGKEDRCMVFVKGSGKLESGTLAAGSAAPADGVLLSSNIPCGIIGPGR
jgi:hypothetical protein